MSFVPGYSHDVFVSYAHDDDRDWIDALVNPLERTLNRLLGTKIALWIDKKDLRPSRNYEKTFPRKSGRRRFS